MNECKHGNEIVDGDRPCRECREEAGLVPCDNPKCTVKEKPVTFEEWFEAAHHWRDHHNMGGCSHGC